MAEMKIGSAQLEVGTWAAALGLLIQKGLRFGSYVDIGCADGYIGLAFWRAGLFEGMDVVNIDANPVYEPSLRKIRGAIGGDYRICAIAEHSGTVELHASAHPYWASAVPPEDAYWATVNGQIGQSITVPCRTLDALVEELAPKKPYALKLDIQGLEAQVLRSGPRALEDTAAVFCEVMVDKFPGINAVMEKAGFELYDLTDIHRLPDNSLGWFYAVFLSRRHGALRSAQVWPEADNADVIEQQHRRRADLLARIDGLVGKIEAERRR